MDHAPVFFASLARYVPMLFHLAKLFKCGWFGRTYTTAELALSEAVLYPQNPKKIPHPNLNISINESILDKFLKHTVGDANLVAHASCQR